jgi:hypothetical protein
MEKEININIIMYKAKLFGFNPQLIEYLVNSKVSLDKDMVYKFSDVFNNIYKIEKEAQMSLP